MKTIKDILTLFPDTKKKDWHQHPNGEGWVYKTAIVEDSAYIGEDAQVFGNTRVYGDAQVYGNTQVSGDARVSGDAQVYGDAWVYGNTRVYGDAWEVSPLYIQGTKHSITNCKHGYIQIGCEIHTFDELIKNYKKIGKQYDYTDKEIKEYYEYIKLFKKIGK